MLLDGFELTIPMLQRAQIFHALDHASTVIGGNEGITPQFLTSSLGRDECGASRLRRFTRGEIARDSHCIGVRALELFWTL
jgi:hypothetical protein